MKALSIDKRKIKNIVQWLLAAVTLLMIVSGYGITKFQIIESITFGLLSKSTAFVLHDALAIPFILLVVLHVVLALKKGKK
ncbi:MAG: cytochrome b/b6 domain-containing protein [Candidatus Micrarchaeota archaeon]